MTKNEVKDKLTDLLKRRSDISATLIQLQLQPNYYSKVNSKVVNPIYEEIKWLTIEIEFYDQLLKTF